MLAKVSLTCGLGFLAEGQDLVVQYLALPQLHQQGGQAVQVF